MRASGKAQHYYKILDVHRELENAVRKNSLLKLDPVISRISSMFTGAIFKGKMPLKR